MDGYECKEVMELVLMVLGAILFLSLSYFVYVISKGSLNPQSEEYKEFLRQRGDRKTSWKNKRTK